MTVLDRQEQRAGSLSRAFARRFARLHRLVNVGSRFQQDASDVSTAFARSEEKRSEARIRQRRMNVGPGSDQQLDDFGVAIGGGPHERSLSATFLRIRVGAALEQRAYGPGLASAARSHQHGFAAAQSGVRV